MEGLPWQSVVTLIACLVSCVVVPLVVWGAVIWAKVGRLEAQLTATCTWLEKVERTPHNCPYIQIRTEHTQQIAYLLARLTEMEMWKREMDRANARREARNE
jgi:hypothetical protein